MQSRQFIRYAIPGFYDIIFISIFIGVIALGPRLFNLDGDLGRHITVGISILANGSIPTRDIFSHTMYGQPVAPHEWLAQVAFAMADRAIGLGGVVLLTATILAAGFTLLYIELITRGVNRPLAILVTILSAAASSVHFLARPHIFTILFLAVFTPLALKISREKSPRSIVMLGLISLIWVNTHGAFIVTYIVLGTVAAGVVWGYYKGSIELDIVKQILLAALLVTGIQLVNPIGLDMIKTGFGYVQNDYLVSHTQEYFSPDFHNPGFYPFLILLTLSLTVFSLGWKRIDLAESLLIGATAGMALISARNIPIFAVVSAPFLGMALQSGVENIGLLKRTDDLLKSAEPAIKGIIFPPLIIILVTFWMNTGLIGRNIQYDPEIFPVQAMDWLKENPQEGNMFNHFPWGGYILYRGFPENKVFIDGQTDFYGEALTREYEQVISLEEMRHGILKKYDVQWAILPAQSGLALQLEEENWEILYKDKTSVVLRQIPSK